MNSQIAFLVLAINILALKNVNCGGKIVGGSEANITDFPYQISFQYKQRHFCGGSIYNEHWIITAAHCVDIFDSPADLGIFAGISKLNDTTNGQFTTVEQFFAHPNFNKENIDYDVALLKLSAPLVFNERVQSIPLSDKTPASGTMGMVSGWGTTNRGGGGSVSNSLKAAEVQVQNPTLCQMQYLFRLTDRMICAGYIFGGTDSCQGDSGGPLKAHGQLAGIVSFGRGCAMSFSPGIYTNVFQVRDFIESTIRNNSDNSTVS